MKMRRDELPLNITFCLLMLFMCGMGIALPWISDMPMWGRATMNAATVILFAAFFWAFFSE
jgi:hypothetical protein